MNSLESIKFLFLIGLAYYLITNLQWYNYSLWRVCTKHHKWRWHLLYFVLPIVFYGVCAFLQKWNIFYAGVFLVYMPLLGWWVARLDKRLKWTGRVWRFFGLYVFLLVLDSVLQFWLGTNAYLDLLPLFVAVGLSSLFEKLFLQFYQKKALEKIKAMSDLQIIAITASYGKTSMKNYLYQILSGKYRVHSTPRSVNTLKGIITDINTQLEEKTQFYIIEAGARQRGDIAEIAQFVNPQYALIGKIGLQHLEYFKTLENIVETKFELLSSNRLKKAFVDKSNPLPKQIKYQETLEFVPEDLRITQASLEGTTFELKINEKWHQFETSVLGSFNAYNIAMAILMAKEIGMPMNEIAMRVKNLNAVEHRLHKSYVNGKVILDDSFNGNFEGMKEAIRIASEYPKRKVIVTPGVVESNEEINIQLAQAMDCVFDLVIITGELNSKILSSHIQNAQKILLKDKSSLENTLKASLREGDLILFANDAPNYI